MKRLIITLLFGLGFGFGLSGCDSGGPCADASGDWNACKAVQVDQDIKGKEAVETRIEGALRENDGIVVNVTSGRERTLGPAITITLSDTDLSILTKDHWLDDESAQAMLEKELKDKDASSVTHIVRLIGAIHRWQDAHPRPVTVASGAPAPGSQPVQVTVTKTVAPPGPPPAPAPSKPILGPFMHWMSMIVTALLAVGALLLVALFGMDFKEYLLRQKRKREAANAKHKAELASVAAKCERDNADYLSGKTDVYGEYRPSNL